MRIKKIINNDRLLYIKDIKIKVNYFIFCSIYIWKTLKINKTQITKN